ncbi:MAG: AAA-like domain-containing protein, partial [Chloroflexi bacterium]|nr:AAA-like domain-containing protein [Chloroflexota bacterium]
MMDVPANATDFFVAGGTLRADAPSYVKRPADDELFNLASAGQFCYVLTPRQMGKSSLMVRTAHRLHKSGVSTAIIDLTGGGTDVSVEQWYLGLITQLKVQLNLSVDPEAWWSEYASLGAVQRFTDFLHDVLLVEIEGPVVIFIDEIDTTLNLDFSDDFFASIRFTYNARASDSIYNRLTFVLLGVTTPADLIKDRSRTPFNIGQGIDLREFSQEDAQVLQQGLKAACGEQGETIFTRIFHWTNGHPYLTQKLCLTVAESGDGSWADERVDELVGGLFLSEEARKETNLQFVRDSVSTSPQRRRLLTLYRKVYEGKAVPEDERSLDQNRLKLFGLLQAERGVLKVRNEIYRRAFNLDWIKANTPVDWTRRIAVISTLLVVLLVMSIAWFIPQQRQQAAEARAQAFVDNFRGTTSAEVRITSLAGLFDLPGYEDQADQLFYQELSPEEQLALFDLADPQAVGAQLITVVQGLYTDLELENDEQGNRLLFAMAQALRE